MLISLVIFESFFKYMLQNSNIYFYLLFLLVLSLWRLILFFLLIGQFFILILPSKFWLDHSQSMLSCLQIHLIPSSPISWVDPIKKWIPSIWSHQTPNSWVVCRSIWSHQTPFLSFARPSFIPGVAQSSIYLFWITQKSPGTLHFGCAEFKCFSALSELLELFILYLAGICLFLLLFPPCLPFSSFFMPVHVEFHFSCFWPSTWRRLKGTLVQISGGFFFSSHCSPLGGNFATGP